MTRSIVFKTALYSAVMCAAVCVAIFGGLFEMQKRIYERQLIREAEENITKVSRYLLGYFYAQGNWVYLEERQKLLDQAPNILYTYLVNLRGQIDLGIGGLESPEIGQAKQSWEPIVPVSTKNDEILRVPFIADAKIAERFRGRVKAGDRIILFAEPIECFTVSEVCGQIRVAIVFDSLLPTLHRLRVSLMLASLLLTLLTGVIVFWVNRRNLLPLKQVSVRMRDLAKQVAGSQETGEAAQELHGLEKNEAEETRFFKESLRQFTTAFQRASVLENELNVTRSLSDLAAQVGHDIRSPLTALEIVISGLTGVAEEKRIILRGALSRIRDIANGLVTSNPQLRSQLGTNPPRGGIDEKYSQVYLLSSLIDVLLSEKRLQYRAQIGIEIEGDLGECAYGVFVKVPAVEFKRVLSNLINNAVESIDKNGSVAVYAEPQKGFVTIRVCDTGAGIPPEILPQLMKKGASHGKQGGSGLGLVHAKSAVKAWGGDLSLNSTVGKGTTVAVTLPVVPAPQWFVPYIALTAETTIVIIDDDYSIHQVWSGRLEALKSLPVPIKILHFSMPVEFFDWFRESKARELEDVLYLVDYEFIGDLQSGLDLIRSLKLQEKSILVTSRFEEPFVVEECSRIGLKMIPKGQAGFVPLKVKPSPETKNVVLIDDDALVRQSWEFKAEQSGVTLVTFGTPEEFLGRTRDFDSATIIFIDSNLGDGKVGEQFAKQIFESGFENIYLATGYERTAAAREPWLKGVSDKTPPEWIFGG